MGPAPGTEPKGWETGWIGNRGNCCSRRHGGKHSCQRGPNLCCSRTYTKSERPQKCSAQGGICPRGHRATPLVPGHGALLPGLRSHPRVLQDGAGLGRPLPISCASPVAWVVLKMARQTDKDAGGLGQAGWGWGPCRTLPRCLQSCCPQMWQGASNADWGTILLLLLLPPARAGGFGRCQWDPQKRQEPRRSRARLSSAASTRLMRVVLSLTLWAASMAWLSDQFSSSSSSSPRVRQRRWAAAWGRRGCSARP